MSELSETSGVLLTFAELEFLLRDAPRWPLMRDQLNGTAPESVQVLDAGVASLLVRGLGKILPDGSAAGEGWVVSLASGLVDSPCPVGVSMMFEHAVAPAVYCPCQDGRRVLVSIEGPGYALFQPLEKNVSPVVQALGLVGQAADVAGSVVAVKAVGRAGVVFRRRGEVWELGDNARDPEVDLDAFFQSSTKDVVMGAVRSYLEANLSQVGV